MTSDMRAQFAAQVAATLKPGSQNQLCLPYQLPLPVPNVTTPVQQQQQPPQQQQQQLAQQIQSHPAVAQAPQVPHTQTQVHQLASVQQPAPQSGLPQPPISHISPRPVTPQSQAQPQRRQPSKSPPSAIGSIAGPVQNLKDTGCMIFQTGTPQNQELMATQSHTLSSPHSLQESTLSIQPSSPVQNKSPQIAPSPTPPGTSQASSQVATQVLPQLMPSQVVPPPQTAQQVVAPQPPQPVAAPQPSQTLALSQTLLSQVAPQQPLQQVVSQPPPPPPPPQQQQLAPPQPISPVTPVAPQQPSQQVSQTAPMQISQAPLQQPPLQQQQQQQQQQPLLQAPQQTTPQTSVPSQTSQPTQVTQQTQKKQSLSPPVEIVTESAGRAETTLLPTSSKSVANVEKNNADAKVQQTPDPKKEISPPPSSPPISQTATFEKSAENKMEKLSPKSVKLENEIEQKPVTDDKDSARVPSPLENSKVNEDYTGEFHRILHYFLKKLTDCSNLVFVKKKKKFFFFFFFFFFYS